MRSRLDRIKDWNELGKNANYDAPTLAGLCRVTLRHLQRFFKERFGQAPQAWLDQLRLSHARDYLKSGLSIKETAFMLHFKCVSHFSRQFKMHHGRTPGSVARGSPADENVAAG